MAMQEFKDFILASEGVADYLPKLFTKISTDPRYRDPDLWFSFSNIPKLGVNPRPSHRDPYGIYLFPKRYVLSTSFGKNTGFFNMPYVFVVKIKPGAHLLNLGSVTRDDAIRILTTMGLQSQVPMLDADSRYGGVQIGQKLWQILDQYIAPEKGRNGEWNVLFSRAGYDGVIDPNTAAIHSNEPDQAVVWSPSQLQIVDLVDNNMESSSKNLVFRILRSIADALFGPGKYEFSGQSSPYRETYYKVVGSHLGKRYQVSMKYKKEGERHNELSSDVSIYSLDSADHNSTSERVSIEYQRDDFAHQIANVAAKFREFMDQDIGRQSSQEDNVAAKVHEVAAAVWGLFGYQPPVQRPGYNSASTRKQYPWGTLILNVSYSGKKSWSDDLPSFRGDMTIVPSSKNSSSRETTLHGNSEVPADTSPEEIAPRMVKEMLANAETAIYQHYNPDPNMHSNDWTRYEWADRGRRFLSALDRIKSIPRIRLLVGHQEAKDEYQQEVLMNRRRIDLKEYLKGFGQRHSRLAALNPPVHYSPGEGIGKVKEMSGNISLGDGFFSLPKDEKDRELTKLVAFHLLNFYITPQFVHQYIGDHPDFPFGTQDEGHAFAECFVRIFIDGDDLSQYPTWRNLVQAAYMKAMASIH